MCWSTGFNGPKILSSFGQIVGPFCWRNFWQFSRAFFRPFLVIFGHFPAKFGAIFRPNVWSFVGQFFGHSIGQIFGHFYSKCSAIFLLNVMNGRRLCWLLSHRGWTE
jgi:hypothetical protein